MNRRIVYYIDNSNLAGDLSNIAGVNKYGFEYKKGIGWEKTINAGGIYKVRYGVHKENIISLVFEVSDKVMCNYFNEGNKIIFKIHESVVQNKVEDEEYEEFIMLEFFDGVDEEELQSKEENSALKLDNDKYIDYWIFQRFDSGNLKKHNEAVADFKASHKTMIAKFKNFDSFNNSFKARFKMHIKNEIINQASSYGVPERLALATWWTESGYHSQGCQYWKSTMTFLHTNGTGVGCMQVEFAAHPGWGVDNLKYSWHTNIKAGIDYLKQCYNKANKHFDTKQLWTDPGETKEEVLARSSYAMYNGGLKGYLHAADISKGLSDRAYYRPWHPDSDWHENDGNFFSNYKNKSWE